MRYFWAFTVFIALGVVAVKAQIFNFEDEDKAELREPATLSPKKRVPSTILTPAAELPEDKDDKEKLNKLYVDIVRELKANNVEGATKLMSDKDVITKQKVIYRLMQENPNDFVPSSEARPTPDAALGGADSDN